MNILDPVFKNKITISFEDLARYELSGIGVVHFATNTFAEASSYDKHMTTEWLTSMEEKLSVHFPQFSFVVYRVGEHNHPWEYNLYIEQGGFMITIDLRYIQDGDVYIRIYQASMDSYRIFFNAPRQKISYLKKHLSPIVEQFKEMILEEKKTRLYFVTGDISFFSEI